MGLRVNKNYMLFILSIWIVLTPPYAMQVVESIRILDLFLSGTIFGIIIIIVVKSKEVPKLLLIFCCIPNLILLISTAINKGNIYMATFQFLRVFLYSLLVETVISRTKYAEYFIRAIRNITWLLFVANIVVIILIPDGFEQINGVNYYLYGNPNVMIRYIVPGLCCSSILDIQKNKLFSFWTLSFFLGLFFTFFATYFSVTAFIGTSFVFAWILMGKIVRTKIRRVRFIYLSVLVAIFLFEIVVVVSARGDHFISILTEFFNKNDLSGLRSRSILWARELNLIFEKPVFGWGMLDSDSLKKFIGNSSGAHNYYLDLLFQRGILGVISFLCIIIYSIIRIFRIKSISGAGYILMGYSCMCFIMFLTEPFTLAEPLIMPLIYIFISIGLKKYSYKTLDI